MGYWLLSKLTAYIRNSFFTAYFRNSVQNCGKGLLVKGPIRLANEGKIIIGDNVIFDSTPESSIKIKVGKSGHLTIGSNVYFNEGVQIICNSSVKIQDFTLVASDVFIIDDDFHPLDPMLRKGYKDSLDTKAPIIIEENVWLCSRAMVLKGVVIGKNSVIAAGAVVAHSIPADVLAAGVPAKHIRKL